MSTEIRRRVRHADRRSIEEIVYNASPATLDRPAGALLAAVRWEARVDPGALDAATFLSRL
jgi:hypothetical protein